MRGIFNVENPVFSGIGKIFDLLALSFVWLLLCLPIITIGPATTALYYTVVKVIRRERGYMMREFFKSFKMNFKVGAIFGVVVIVLNSILYVDYRFAKALIKEGKTSGQVLLIIFMLLFIILSFITIYLFPILSRFTMTNLQLIKAAFAISMKHLPSTFLMFVLIVALILGVYIFPLAIIIMPGLMMLLLSFLMERILKQYTPEPEEGSDESEMDKWYLE